MSRRLRKARKPFHPRHLTREQALEEAHLESVREREAACQERREQAEEYGHITP